MMGFIFLTFCEHFGENSDEDLVWYLSWSVMLWFVMIIVMFLFLDEAPDTGDDSDEDLVTNYLANGTGTVGATSDNLVPTIHITPQSPNGNHVLGKT